jgi:hypothetical protein
MASVMCALFDFIALNKNAKNILSSQILFKKKKESAQVKICQPLQ